MSLTHNGLTYITNMGDWSYTATQTISTNNSGWLDRYVEYTPRRAVWYDTSTGEEVLQWVFKNGQLFKCEVDEPITPNVDDLL